MIPSRSEGFAWTVSIFSGYDCRSSATLGSNEDLPRLVGDMSLTAEGMWGPNDDASGNFE